MTDPGSAQVAYELLDERYGRGRKRKIDKRFGWVAASFLIIAGVVFVAFGGWQESANIEFKTLAYEVVDDRTVAVDVQVTSPENSEVICTIEALSTSRATVGWKLVELPASEDRTRRFSTTLVTTSPATTGRVYECWEHGQM